jgi:hypothetical protein
MASTFYALLDLADLDAYPPVDSPSIEVEAPVKSNEPEKSSIPSVVTGMNSPEHHAKAKPTLHYNIQIHLPATKDIEVFNSIFKALKEHLLD